MKKRTTKPTDSKQSRGVNLLEFEDEPGLPPMAETDAFTVGANAIPPAVKQAVVIEKANGAPTRLIAIRYDISPDTVNRIWREFCQSASKVRRIADESPDETKKWLRSKALVAIESGLECDRDPYRRAGVGIHVMKGIGEFKSDQPEGSKVAIMIGSLPEDWRTRYIPGPPLVKGGKEGGGHDDNR